MRRSAIVMGLCLALAVGCAAGGKIVYVDDDAPAGGDGRSWQTAYQYLQDALADARTIDKPAEIRIAQGTYKPNQVTDQTWWRFWFELTSGVALMGGYAGIGASDPNTRDIPVYETILSGDLAGNDVEVDDPCDLPDEPTRADNTGLLTTVYQAEDVLLDGITIAGGRVISPVETRGGTGGGAIVIRDSSPTINNCTFRGNTAEIYGGAVFISGGHPTFTNCIFVKNYAYGGGAIRGGQEGTIISNCSFTENTAGSSGGAIIGCAGTISGCTFQRNASVAGGGGALASCRGLISHCLFLHNTAGDYGGAISSSGYRLSCRSCVFAENKAALSGGGLFMSSSNVIMANCSFWGNAAPNGSAITVYTWTPAHPPSGLQLTSSILWDEGNEIWQNDNSIIGVRYSDIRGGYAGVGNLNADPLFADPNNGDFHLKSQGGRWVPGTQSWVEDSVISPCIDTGDPNSPIGQEPFPNGGRSNMGAYGGTEEASKSYFGKTPCATIIAGDINGDCRVDWKDLALLARHWLKTN